VLLIGGGNLLRRRPHRRSLQDGRVFVTPPEPLQRYQAQGTTANFVIWRLDRRRRTIAGKNLRIEVLEPALIHWSIDGWQTPHDDPTHDTGIGVYVFDLPAAKFAPGTTLAFTMFWTQRERWEGSDFSIEVIGRE
jgi:glucoamylase